MEVASHGMQALLEQLATLALRQIVPLAIYDGYFWHATHQQIWRVLRKQAG
ncbi:hypothetical protein D3C72_2411030 [compost metagenome]